MRNSIPPPASPSRARILVLPALALACAAAPAPAQTQDWVTQTGTIFQEGWADIVPDGAGGMIAVGLTDWDLGGPSAGMFDAVLARFDSSGNVTSIQQYGGSGSDAISAATPDGSGGIYVTGYTQSSLGGPFLGEEDAWLARYDAAGSQLWVRQLGTSDQDWGTTVTYDGSGGVYVGGFTDGDLAGPGAGVGVYDAWLARYDGSGNQLWIRQLGSSSYDYLYGSAPDGNGGVYVTGTTSGAIGTWGGAGGDDMWTARYDGAGNKLWVKQYGTAAKEESAEAVPDGAGGVIVVGSTRGDMWVPSSGGADYLIFSFDASGDINYLRQFGTPQDDGALDAVSDGAGGLYLAGYTRGSLWSTHQGDDDAWLAHIDASGFPTWGVQLGTSGLDRSWCVAADGLGHVFVGGETWGDLAGPNQGYWDAWAARFTVGCPAPTTYCTAKVNSLGCTPAISSAGSPSASHATAFRIRATNVVSSSFGLLIYSKTGADAKPFQGGLLCVASPVLRTALQASGGSPPPKDCTGVFAFEFNDFIASGKDPGLLAGQPVWTQYWYRDQGSASGTGLTDGLHFTICP